MISDGRATLKPENSFWQASSIEYESDDKKKLRDSYNFYDHFWTFFDFFSKRPVASPPFGSFGTFGPRRCHKMSLLCGNYVRIGHDNVTTFV